MIDIAIDSILKATPITLGCLSAAVKVISRCPALERVRMLWGCGAITSLIAGFMLGMGRLIAELNKNSLSGFFYWYSDINFLHFALFLFVVCAVVLVLVSFITPAPFAQHTAGLTFQTAEQQPTHAEAFDIPDAQEHLPELTSDSRWRRWELRFSVLLAIIVGIIWLYFTG